PEGGRCRPQVHCTPVDRGLDPVEGDPFALRAHVYVVIVARALSLAARVFVRAVTAARSRRVVRAPPGDVSSRADEFLVEELLNAGLAEFGADAGAFRAAEGEVGFGPGCLVDPHHAGVDAASHPSGVLDVIADDAAAESVARLVGQRDR